LFSIAGCWLGIQLEKKIIRKTGQELNVLGVVLVVVVVVGDERGVKCFHTRSENHNQNYQKEAQTRMRRLLRGQVNNGIISINYCSDDERKIMEMF